MVETKRFRIAKRLQGNCLDLVGVGAAGADVTIELPGDVPSEATGNDASGLKSSTSDLEKSLPISRASIGLDAISRSSLFIANY